MQHQPANLGGAKLNVTKFHLDPPKLAPGKWLADAGFSVTNLGNLDKIRHNQGFPNLSWKMVADGWFSQKRH